MSDRGRLVQADREAPLAFGGGDSVDNSGLNGQRASLSFHVDVLKGTNVRHVSEAVAVSLKLWVSLRLAQTLMIWGGYNKLRWLWWFEVSIRCVKASGR
ncbi:MAG: hypothetical protein ACKESB_02170 [Candidatus Hodgkinia cicadicola]